MAQWLGTPPDEKAEGRQIIMYGPPFSGKTSTLADPNVKVLLGDMDHNTSPLDNADNVTIFPIEEYSDYENMRESVRRGYFEIGGKKIPCTDFDIICFDSFTRFEELIKQYVLKFFAPNRKRELNNKFGAQSDWQDLQDIEVREVRDWQAMTRTHGFNVIWMGHDMQVVDSMKVPTHIQLALQGKYASNRIMGAVDAVVYLQKYTDKDGKVQRAVHTNDFQMIKADARMPMEKRAALPPVLPVEKWSWSKILPYLGYNKVPK